MKTKTRIGTTIKKIRHKRGMKQYELSKMAGVIASHLSLIETNKFVPRPEMLSKISEVLGVPVPVMWFMSIDEEDVAPDKIEAWRKVEGLFNSIIQEIFIDKRSPDEVLYRQLEQEIEPFVPNLPEPVKPIKLIDVDKL